MRTGLVVVGIVLLIIGVLAAGLTFQQTQPETVPVAPNALTVSLNTLVAGTMTISWSGGSDGETFSVFECTSTACSNPGSPVVSGHGASGSVSLSVVSGGTYALQVTGGPAVSASVVLTGFTILTFVGVILAAIGAFLLVIGIIAKRRTRAAPAEVEAPTPAARGPPSFAGETPGQEWHAGPSGQETIMKARVEAPQAAQGTQQYIKCASCGTLNEPWLHNCRWCQRPLETTASG
jgi:hypothetical protein